MVSSGMESCLGAEKAKKQTIIPPQPPFDSWFFFYWNTVRYTPDAIRNTPSEKFHFCLVSRQYVLIKIPIDAMLSESILLNNELRL